MIVVGNTLLLLKFLKFRLPVYGAATDVCQKVKTFSEIAGSNKFVEIITDCSIYWLR